MKKLYLFLCVISLILLSACSADDAGNDDNYLTVELNSTPTQSRLTASMLGTSSRVRIKGTMNQEDFKVLYNSTTIQHLDLTDVNVVGKILVAYDSEPIGDTPLYQENNAIPFGAFGEHIDAESGSTDNVPANNTLQTIQLPKTITTIGRRAFTNCQGLIEIPTFPAGLKKILNFSFDKCHNMRGEFNFPDSLEVIGNAAFGGCKKMTGTLKLPSKITTVFVQAFIDCIGITKLELHENISLIGPSSFAGMTGLTSLTLPKNLSTIDYSAFQGCAGLRGSLTMPESLGQMADRVFVDCGFDGTLTLNKNLYEMRDYVFYNTNFKAIVLNWETSDEIPEGWHPVTSNWFPENFETSKGKTDYIIYIPIGTMDVYKSAFSDANGNVFYNFKEGKP